MLTPNYLMNAAEPMVELWAQLECDIIADISRRIIKSGGKMTATAQWQTVKALEIGALQSDLSKKIAKTSAQSENAVSGMILDACEDALAFDDALYRKAGLDPQPITQSPALMEVVEAGIRKTGGLMRNFTNTTARTAAQAFENSLDIAYMQVISGAFSFDGALRNVIQTLALKGIERIVYPSGSSIHMDAAARRALLTGLNQTTAELQLARMDQLGVHLLEVTSHAGARPSHAKWQGQVYWRGEPVKGYENFEDSTGYGTGDGLCGWNCYHNFFPFFEGLSMPAFERDPSARLGKTNDQVYEENQRQRAHERRIRESRRECAAYSSSRDAATDAHTKSVMDSMFNEASVRLKRREASLDRFIDETNRTKSGDRLYVPGYNRSVSAKASAANRKYTQYHYRKDGSIIVTDDWKGRNHASPPRKYLPYAVIETVSGKHRQVDRSFYGADGVIVKQIHSQAHLKHANSDYGNGGAHAHDFVGGIRVTSYDGGKHGRELTTDELREVGDVIDRR